MSEAGGWLAALVGLLVVIVTAIAQALRRRPKLGPDVELEPLCGRWGSPCEEDTAESGAVPIVVQAGSAVAVPEEFIEPKAADFPNRHAWARELITIAFRERYDRDPTLPEAQAAQAVANSETQYGAGWGAKKPDGSYRTCGGNGIGSNNWGAVQAGRTPCDPERAFPCVDTHPTDTGGSIPYAICFRKYATPLDGARGVVEQVFGRRPSVLAAARAGDLSAFSKAMHKTGYYEGQGATVADRIANHTKWIEGSVAVIASALKEPIALRRRSGGGSAALAIGALVLGGATALLVATKGH